MVSSKERQKLSRMFDKQAEHLNNQRKSIDRLLLVNLEMRAALLEIASMDEYAGIKDAQDRAQQALDRVDEVLAAEQQKQAESKETTTKEGEASDE